MPNNGKYGDAWDGQTVTSDWSTDRVSDQNRFRQITNLATRNQNLANAPGGSTRSGQRAIRRRQTAIEDMSDMSGKN